MDPTMPGVGTNRYSYSENDPINKSDPNGHTTAVAGGGGLIGAIEGFFSAIGSALGLGAEAAGAAGVATVAVVAGGVLMATTTPTGDGELTSSEKRENSQRAAAGAPDPDDEDKNKNKDNSNDGNKSNQEVEFGQNENQTSHAARHLEESGFDKAQIQEIKDLITKDIQAKGNMAQSSYARNTISYNGTTVEYRAFGLANGKVNVGTIFTK